MAVTLELQNIVSDERVIAKFQDSKLPRFARFGELYVVNGILYIFADLEDNKIGRWYPLNNKRTIRFFEQNSRSKTWSIPFGYKTTDLQIIVYDENDKVHQVPYTVDIGNDVINIVFDSDEKGKVYFFDSYMIDWAVVDTFGVGNNNFQVTDYAEEPGVYHLEVDTTHLTILKNGNANFKKDMLIGGDLSVSGFVDFAGDFKVNQNLQVVGNTHVNGNTIIDGNLSVLGVTTTINTEEIKVADNIITLNSNANVGFPFQDAGIEVERGALDNKIIVQWDETNDRTNIPNDTKIDGTLEVVKPVTLLDSLTVNEVCVFNDHVSVYANQAIYGNLFLYGYAIIDETLEVRKDAHLLMKLTVDGTSLFNDNVVMEANQDVKGNVIVDENITIKGNAAIKGAVSFDGNLSVGGNIFLTGNHLIGTDLIVDGVSLVRGESTFEGLSTFKSNVTIRAHELITGNLTINGSETINTNLQVDGNSSVTGNLAITGTSVFYDNVHLSQDMVIDRLLTVHSNSIFNANMTINANELITGNLQVNGSTYVVGNSVIDGNLTVKGTMTTINSTQVNIVDNIITLNSNVTVEPFLNAGIEVERGIQENKIIVQWDELNDKTHIPNNTKIDGTLEAVGATTLSSTLGVTGVSTFNSNMTVNANGLFTGNLQVNGHTTVNGNLLVTGLMTTIESQTLVIADNVIVLNATVTGDPILDAGIDVGRGNAGTVTMIKWDEAIDKTVIPNNTNITGTLEAVGATTLSSTLGVTGATTLTGLLTANGAIAATNITASGILGVTGVASFGSTVGISGQALLGSTLAVTGATTLSSTLAVNGNSTFTGLLTANGAISATNITASGTLGVTGAASFGAAVNITGASTLTGLLTANGGLSTTNLSISGALDVTGGMTLSGPLSATGGISTANLSATGTLGVTGATTLGSTLVVNSTTTLRNNLQLDTSANIVGTLTVADVSTFNSNMTVNASQSITGDLQVNGNTTLNGNVTFQGATVNINATTLNVVDRIVTLNTGSSGAPTLNAGLEIKRGDAGILALITFDETNDKVVIPVHQGSGVFIQDQVVGKIYADTEITTERLRAIAEENLIRATYGTYADFMAGFESV